MGQFHTLEISANHAVEIRKHSWDEIFLKRLQDATDISKTADVAAIILQEGVAHILLIGAYMTVEKQKIEVNIPKKRYTATAHNKV